MTKFKFIATSEAYWKYDKKVLANGNKFRQEKRFPIIKDSSWTMASKLPSYVWESNKPHGQSPYTITWLWKDGYFMEYKEVVLCCHHKQSKKAFVTIFFVVIFLLMSWVIPPHGHYLWGHQFRRMYLDSFNAHDGKRNMPKLNFITNWSQVRWRCKNNMWALCGQVRENAKANQLIFSG